MSRHNSLYVDVMGVDSIISAIDRAEEQLFSAIETAMAYNIPSGRGGEGKLSTTPTSQSAPEPVERMNAYDQLAARVESGAHRKKSSAAPAAVKRSPAAAAPAVREVQRKRPGVKPVQARVAIDVDGVDDVVHVKDIENDVQVLSPTTRKEWKPTAAPAKSSLSKRAPVKLDLRTDPKKAAIAQNALSGHVWPKPKAEELRQKSNFQSMGSMPAATRPSTSAPSVVAGSANTRHPIRPLPAKGSAVPGSVLNGASRIPSRSSSPATYAPKLASSVPSTLTPPAAPGVIYVPGVCAIGRTQPNGFRETAEGLRPVVTLAQRPKVPLAMRQTLADKLFVALKARNISDMDAVVDSTLTEQRYVGWDTRIFFVLR